jgi:dTDP-4-amino-4,6-dideoxygalactose transaminase
VPTSARAEPGATADIIPLVDLKAQYRTIRSEVLAAVSDVLDSMRLTLGPNVASFEDEFAAYCGTAHCIGAGNGTDALVLALRAIEVGPGDEVIVPAHTFIATAEAVSLAGAQPVVIDVEPLSRCLNPDQLEAAITPRTRAVIPVHIHGQMADMDAIVPIARRHGLAVIEDAAQAHGAELRGHRAGSAGDMGCFSFYCSKNLGAYGEAGAITTDDEHLAQRLRLIRNHGETGHYEHASLGGNSRLDEIQAAILRIKLKRLDEWNAARRRHAARLAKLLDGAGIEGPIEAPGRTHIYHHFAVLSEQRDALATALKERGVMTGVHYPRPIHLQPPYQGLGLKAGALPVSERITESVLSLPMYPELTDPQIERIAEAVRTALEQVAARRA